MKKFVFAVSMLIIFLLVLQPAEAAFPEKAITILNSSVAGSPTDALARQVAHHAEQYLGQPLIVVNRPGGGGGVMFGTLLNAPADGYTIASATGIQFAALHAQLKGQFSFDDFDFLVNAQHDYMSLSVLPDSPYQSIGDIVEAAKGGTEIFIGGQGTGSTLHMIVLWLAHLADIELKWLPYQGGAESVTNLLGGHVDAIITGPTTVMPYVDAGQIKVIANCSAERLSSLPDSPTFKEQGYDIVTSQYRGFIVRKGVPEDIRAKLVDALSKTLQQPELVEFMKQLSRLEEDGFMGSEEFARFAREEFDKLGDVMKLTGLSEN